MKTLEKLAVIVVLDVVMFSAALVGGAVGSAGSDPSQPNPIYRGDELQGIAIGSAPPPRQFLGLHMAFSQEWPQGVYEIGSSGQKPPSSSVRVVCGGCPTMNWVFNLSPDSASDKEKLMVNAATLGVILMAGNGRLTLLEWNP